MAQTWNGPGARAGALAGASKAVLAAERDGSEPTPHVADWQQRHRFERLVERLHALGPRAVGEILIEVSNGADLLERLADFASLDPATVRALGADRFAASPLSLVRRRAA